MTDSTTELGSCDHHDGEEAKPRKDAVIEYDDGTQWCQECHEANLGAAAAIGGDSA